MSIVVDSFTPPGVRSDRIPPAPIALHHRHLMRASDYRMLVFGPEELTGHGSRPPDLPFSGLLARDVSRALGDGVDFSSVVSDGATADRVAQATAGYPLADADAIVLLVEAATGATDEVRDLMEAVRARMTAEACLVVAVLGADAASVTDRIASDESDELACGTTAVVALDDGAGDVSVTDRAGRWTDRVGRPLLEQRRPSGWWLDPMTIDESSRSRQARRVERVSASTVRELEKVVDAACAAYGTRAGAVNVLIGGTATFLAARDVDGSRMARPREETLCHTVVMEGCAVAVPDARQDPRFADVPAVRDGDVRFYAGHPLRTPGGFRVGALCVWDREPRAAADGAFLRRLAREVEAILCLDIAVTRPTPRADDAWLACERCA